MCFCEFNESELIYAEPKPKIKGINVHLFLLDNLLRLFISRANIISKRSLKSARANNLNL